MQGSTTFSPLTLHLHSVLASLISAVFTLVFNETVVRLRHLFVPPTRIQPDFDDTGKHKPHTRFWLLYYYVPGYLRFYGIISATANSTNTVRGWILYFCTLINIHENGGWLGLQHQDWPIGGFSCKKKERNVAENIRISRYYSMNQIYTKLRPLDMSPAVLPSLLRLILPFWSECTTSWQMHLFLKLLKFNDEQLEKKNITSFQQKQDYFL